MQVTFSKLFVEPAGTTKTSLWLSGQTFVLERAMRLSLVVQLTLPRER